MNIILEILILISRIFYCYIKSFVRWFYKPKKDISGRTALVTGGGGGIARYIAQELAQRKVRIALWDINKVSL